jgi:tmRNA-binding protein
VFVAAAKVGGINANNTRPAEFIFQNLQIQNNLIHGAYVAGVRKLLLHHREILKLKSLSEKAGHAVFPLALYWKNGKVKVALAVGRGKAQYDKREDLKRRESDRELKRVTLARLAPK